MGYVKIFRSDLPNNKFAHIRFYDFLHNIIICLCKQVIILLFIIIN